MRFGREAQVVEQVEPAFVIVGFVHGFASSGGYHFHLILLYSSHCSSRAGFSYPDRSGYRAAFSLSSARSSRYMNWLYS